MYKDNQANSVAAEVGMHKIAGVFKPWNCSIEKIITTVYKYYPRRVMRVMEILEEEGFSSLKQANRRTLSDHLLGLDEVFQIPTKSGRFITVGVDVTINSEEVENKRRKLNKFKPMLNELDINYTIVAIWSDTTPVAQWSQQQQKAMARKIIAQVQGQIELDTFVGEMVLSL